MNPLALQALGGLLLAAFVAWQLLTGLRIIKLPPRHHFQIHRWTGITMAVLVVPHLLFGLYLAFGWFAGVFGPLLGA